MISKSNRIPETMTNLPSTIPKDATINKQLEFATSKGTYYLNLYKFSTKSLSHISKEIPSNSKFYQESAKNQKKIKMKFGNDIETHLKYSLIDKIKKSEKKSKIEKNKKFYEYKPFDFQYKNLENKDK